MQQHYTTLTQRKFKLQRYYIFLQICSKTNYFVKRKFFTLQFFFCIYDILLKRKIKRFSSF